VFWRISLVLLATGLTAPGLPGPAPADVAGRARLGAKPQADAVIWLEAPGAARPARAPEAVLEQRDLQFFPRVLVVQVGTKVRFPNDDRVFHNVFSYHDGTKFDLGLYPVGMVHDVPFKVAGLSRIFCNIHPQMAAYVMVVDSPFFAVSDAQGQFVLKGVPAATYRYHAWRPGGAILTDSVTVGSSDAFEIVWK
jgi:plastocyanin